MQIHIRPHRPAARRTYVAAVGLLTLAAIVAAAHLPGARAASVSQLQRQIGLGRNRVDNLAGTVGAASARLGRLSAGINGLQRRIGAIQLALDAKRGALLKLRDELATARDRLAHLQALQTRSEAVLARQLVGSYEAQPPDIITVVLEATGFRDLLERLSFVQRIQHEDARVVRTVRVARTAVAAQATHLGGLTVHAQALAEQVLAQRNTLAQARVVLVAQEQQVARFGGAKAGQLASARGELVSLQRRLSSVQAAQARAARAAAVAAQSLPAASDSGSGASPAPAAAPSGGGGFVFPLPKSAASPPGSWSPDQGVDISAPGNTPEYAVCSGTIVLHGIGGFGPWAPVLHCDSPVGGYGYVYYGHAGPAYQLPVGTHVGAGQVMSSIGPGIVGISTGPHLEIGFATASGAPVGAGSAGTMMSLLSGAY
jgi:murein DD-endopeptidase MepM/ murein hydrolase activator NlpD